MEIDCPLKLQKIVDALRNDHLHSLDYFLERAVNISYEKRNSWQKIRSVLVGDTKASSLTELSGFEDHLNNMQELIKITQKKILYQQKNRGIASIVNAVPTVISDSEEEKIIYPSKPPEKKVKWNEPIPISDINDQPVVIKNLRNSLPEAKISLLNHDQPVVFQEMRYRAPEAKISLLDHDQPVVFQDMRYRAQEALTSPLDHVEPKIRSQMPLAIDELFVAQHNFQERPPPLLRGVIQKNNNSKQYFNKNKKRISHYDSQQSHSPRHYYDKRQKHSPRHYQDNQQSHSPRHYHDERQPHTPRQYHDERQSHSPRNYHDELQPHSSRYTEKRRESYRDYRLRKAEAEKLAISRKQSNRTDLSRHHQRSKDKPSTSASTSSSSKTANTKDKTLTPASTSSSSKTATNFDEISSKFLSNFVPTNEESTINEPVKVPQPSKQLIEMDDNFFNELLPLIDKTIIKPITVKLESVLESPNEEISRVECSDIEISRGVSQDNGISTIDFTDKIATIDFTDKISTIDCLDENANYEPQFVVKQEPEEYLTDIPQSLFKHEPELNIQDTELDENFYDNERQPVVVVKQEPEENPSDNEPQLEENFYDKEQQPIVKEEPKEIFCGNDENTADFTDHFQNQNIEEEPLDL